MQKMDEIVEQFERGRDDDDATGPMDFHALAQGFGVAFRFSRTQELANERVSTHLGCDESEGCERPLYYALDRVTFRGMEWLSVTYSLFYRRNPGYSLFGGFIKAGEHPVDVERVVVLFPLTNGVLGSEPGWVYFGAHGRGQGVWREWRECERMVVVVTSEEEGDMRKEVLNVYVSPTSHGMYPEARVYLRLFGFANDVCVGDGEVWIPKVSCRCDARKQSWSVSHYQVKRGINSPANISPPIDRSIDDMERLCLAFPSVMKKVREGGSVEVIERL